MIREEGSEGKKIPRLAGARNFPGFSPSIHGEIRGGGGGAKKRMKLLLKILFQPVEIHSATLNIHFQTAFEGINGDDVLKFRERISGDGGTSMIGKWKGKRDRKEKRRVGESIRLHHAIFHSVLILSSLFSIH